MISCIVTTYKRPVGVLKRAVDSILCQTFQDIEIIVINDAPEDTVQSEAIRKLLNRYNKDIRYAETKMPKGACNARNMGIEMATGEYLAFLDDDDEWLPGKLEQQMSCMKENPCALVYCAHYFVDKEGKKRLIREPFAATGIREYEFERLLCCNFIGSTSYPLLRRDAIEAVGGFSEALESSQDHDLWLRIAEKYSICYCEEPLVNLYYSEDSISRDKEKLIQGYEYLLEQYGEYYEKDRELKNYRLNYLAFCCLKNGMPGAFWRYWMSAWKVKALSRHNLMPVGRLFYRLGIGVPKQKHNRIKEWK